MPESARVRENEGEGVKVKARVCVRGGEGVCEEGDRAKGTETEQKGQKAPMHPPQTTVLPSSEKRLSGLNTASKRRHTNCFLNHPDQTLAVWEEM